MKDGCRSNGICLSGDDGDNNQYDFDMMMMMMVVMMMMMNFLISVYLNDKDDIEKSEVGHVALICRCFLSSHQCSGESL